MQLSRQESALLTAQMETTIVTVFAAVIQASYRWFQTAWTVVGVFGMTMAHI